MASGVRLREASASQTSGKAALALLSPSAQAPRDPWEREVDEGSEKPRRAQSWSKAALSSAQGFRHWGKVALLVIVAILLIAANTLRLRGVLTLCSRHCTLLRVYTNDPLVLPGPDCDPKGTQTQRVDDGAALTSADGGSGTEVSDKVTLVLPLTLKDLPRASLLFASLVFNLDARAVSRTIVLVRPSEFAAMSTLLSPQHPLRFWVVKQTLLIPSRVARNVHGYYLQMALKLLVHRLVRTRFYLCLDADIVLMRPTTLAELVDKDGRAVYQREPKGYHASWWRHSEALLRVPETCVPPDDGFGVTPALLARNVSAHAIEILQRELGWFWMHRWLRRITGSVTHHFGPQWSEYTMYRVAACEARTFGEFHAVRANEPPLYIGVWSHEQAEWRSNDFCHLASQARFLVIQSTLPLSTGDIARRVACFTGSVEEEEEEGSAKIEYETAGEEAEDVEAEAVSSAAVESDARRDSRARAETPGLDGSPQDGDLRKDDSFSGSESAVEPEPGAPQD